jgi:hypothetical protein
MTICMVTVEVTGKHGLGQWCGHDEEVSAIVGSEDRVNGARQNPEGGKGKRKGEGRHKSEGNNPWPFSGATLT